MIGSQTRAPEHNPRRRSRTELLSRETTAPGRLASRPRFTKTCAAARAAPAAAPLLEGGPVPLAKAVLAHGHRRALATGSEPRGDVVVAEPEVRECSLPTTEAPTVRRIARQDNCPGSASLQPTPPPSLELPNSWRVAEFGDAIVERRTQRLFAVAVDLGQPRAPLGGRLQANVDLLS